ncbi:MAG: hypothetical protein R3E12_11055 [Candidatus Eisenbacteria bacterium]
MGQLDPQLDPRLQRLVARCMAKDAAQRIPDLAEAIRELETIIAHPAPKVDQTRANANADATTVVPRDRKHAPPAAPSSPAVAPAAAPAHGVPQAPRAAAPSANARAAAPAAGAPAPAREPKREPDRSSRSHPTATSGPETRGSGAGRRRALPWFLALAAAAVVAIVVFVWSPWSGGSGGSEPAAVADARDDAVAAAAAIEGGPLPDRLATQRARADSLRLTGDRARDERSWNEAAARYRDAAGAYERVARETRDYRTDEAHAREASTAMLAARTAVADTASADFTRARGLEADADRALAAEDPARAEHLYREAGGIFSRLAPTAGAPERSDALASGPQSEANGKPATESRTPTGNDGARSGKKPDPAPAPKNATGGSELADGSTGNGPSSNASSRPPKGTDPRDTSPAGDPTPAGTEAGATTGHETPAPLAPTLSGLVAERFDTVAPALAAAMQSGTWSGLPKPVQSQYQKFYQALTQDHLLRDARVVGRTLSESPTAVEQLVTVTVTQQQKGTDALQDPLDMPMIWTWTLDGGEAIVSAIRPRP